MKHLLIGLLTLGSLSAFAGSTPYEKATKLSESRLGCQLQREALESELSNGSETDPEVVEALKTIYDACFNELVVQISKDPYSNSTWTSLIEHRLVCDKERKVIETLLSENMEDLDFPKIERAKKRVYQCRDKVEAILMN